MLSLLKLLRKMTRLLQKLPGRRPQHVLKLPGENPKRALKLPGGRPQRARKQPGENPKHARKLLDGRPQRARKQPGENLKHALKLPDENPKRALKLPGGRPQRAHLRTPGRRLFLKMFPKQGLLSRQKRPLPELALYLQQPVRQGDGRFLNAPNSLLSRSVLWAQAVSPFMDCPCFSAL
jgi:hypothetical protein